MLFKQYEYWLQSLNNQFNKKELVKKYCFAKNIL